MNEAGRDILDMTQACLKEEFIPHEAEVDKKTGSFSRYLKIYMCSNQTEIFPRMMFLTTAVLLCQESFFIG